MAERAPSTREKLTKRAVALLIGGMAVAGCTSGNNVEPAPQPSVTATTEAQPSPEQLAQTEVRKDAAATVQLVGSMLRSVGGKSVYDGARVDNFGDVESDTPPADRPGIAVTRNSQTHEMTVAVTSPEPGGQGFRMQIYIDGQDPLMQAPELNADLLAAGPNAENLEMEDLTMTVNNGSGYSETPLIQYEGRNLIDANDLQSPELTVSGADKYAALVGSIVENTAAGLEAAGYQGVAEDLPEAAVHELQD